ncbi:hypothetical protein ACFWUP_01345 [Nocardia sp. NPDC058658]|uniref:hypothetical protein n=1 Tax=Nocardia sp. NPDC058658 TaxID=3346580 RepID=UPI00365571A7
MGITMFSREANVGGGRGRSGHEQETAEAIDIQAHRAMDRFRAAICLIRISLWRLLFHGRLLLSMLLVGSSPDADHLLK